MYYDKNDEKILIEGYCKEIINILGEKYQYLSNDYNKPDGDYQGKYEDGGRNFGISISATYTDSSYSEFQTICVKFKDRTVYETIYGKNHIFDYGAWREVLKELAYGAPNIKKREREILEEKRKIDEHAVSLYRDYIKHICKNGFKTDDIISFKINNTLSFHKYFKYYPGGYGDSATFYHRFVKKNGETVLDLYTMDDECFRDDSYISVEKYIPGDWEEEIISYCHDKIEYHDEIEKENNEVLEAIKRLKKY